MRPNIVNFIAVTLVLLLDDFSTTAQPIASVPSSNQGWRTGNSGRPAVINGRIAESTSFRWMVSLRVHGGHFCGGVLVTDELVVSAAHCFFYPGTDTAVSKHEITVVVGTYKLNDYLPVQVFRVRNITLHPRFEPYVRNPNLDYDIAVLRLQTPIPTQGNLTVDMISLFPEVAAVAPGSMLVAVGWGKTQGSSSETSSDLLKVSLPVLSPGVCQERLDSHVVTDTVLCTDSTDGDICQGDSGGALISSTNSRDTLVGIISMSSPGCGHPFSASVYTRISMFSAFLRPFFPPYNSGHRNHTATQTTARATFPLQSRKASERRCDDDFCREFGANGMKSLGPCRSEFCHCAQGVAYPKNCPGAIFDPSLLICNWASNIPGCKTVAAP